MTKLTDILLALSYRDTANSYNTISPRVLITVDIETNVRRQLIRMRQSIVDSITVESINNNEY